MYTVEFTYEAEDDLGWFSRREQNIILDGIESNLIYEPNVITRNRHPCRDDKAKIADWELRLGVFRVFYNIEESVQIISIERIGKKPNNTVFLRGQ